MSSGAETLPMIGDRYPRDRRDAHFVTGEDGHSIEIPRELYEALKIIIETDKPTGNLEIQFRNGGISHVNLHTTRKLK